MVYDITVPLEQSGQRLDKWLATLDFIPSRSRAVELIQRGRVTVNKKVVKCSHKIASGQEVRIEMPARESSSLLALDAPLEILHEDQDVVVINKPAGLVVHPSAGHSQDTLVNILLHHIDQLSMGFNEQRPGIVHRLDRDTSGILVVAKNDLAHQKLAEQFRSKSAHRIYWALTHHRAKVSRGSVRSLLIRDPADRKKFASSKNGAGPGKLAVTHYLVLQSNASYSWIQCQLETGRTHQIRVHLSESGLPIVGDIIYGAKVKDKKLNFVTRMALHASELGFRHPRSGQDLLFKVPWPTQLSEMALKMGFDEI